VHLPKTVLPWLLLLLLLLLLTLLGCLPQLLAQPTPYQQKTGKVALLSYQVQQARGTGGTWAEKCQKSLGGQMQQQIRCWTLLQRIWMRHLQLLLLLLLLLLV
jgi:hypothetical protein